MFQILAGTVFAKQHNVKPSFHFTETYILDTILDVKISINAENLTSDKWPISTIETVNSHIENQKYRQPFVYIRGFFEDWSFIKHHQVEAYHLFRFKKPLQLKSEICIHLRLGDLAEYLPRAGDAFPNAIAHDIISKEIPSTYPIVFICETPEHRYVRQLSLIHI